MSVIIKRINLGTDFITVCKIFLFMKFIQQFLSACIRQYSGSNLLKCVFMRFSLYMVNPDCLPVHPVSILPFRLIPNALYGIEKSRDRGDHFNTEKSTLPSINQSVNIFWGFCDIVRCPDRSSTKDWACVVIN